MKNLAIILLCFTGVVTHCQSWQWGKRGGSIDQLDTTGGARQEEVFAVVTDSNKNIYTLSYVGKNNLNIDGNVKTNFGDSTTLTDVALSSFSCDGTYRWSKIIGGGGYDQLNSIQIDGQNNIYISGKFADCDFNTSFPPRIDSDFILNQNPQDCSLIFLAKYSSTGVFQWLKRPQSSSVSFSDGIGLTASYGHSTDVSGNSYWLVSLPAGSYANGAFTASLPGAASGSPYYIFKYDSNGNFLNGLYLDFQLTGGANNVKYSRNPYNGSYYFSSVKSSSTDTAVIGGQTISHPAFIWSFNDLGQFQWLKESTSTTNYNTIRWFNFQFDPQNNIYIGGRFSGFTGETFMGMATSQGNSPPFIMKLDPIASTALWHTFPNRGTTANGGIVLNGNEIALTASGITNPYAWGTQSMTVSNIGQGYDIIFARFNKDTGVCLGLSTIPADIGYDDTGCSVAVDASGDYILGGGFGHQLTFTTNTLLNIGQQSDFFVSKYSTSVCSLGTEDFKEEGLELYPNPVESLVKVTTLEDLKFTVYSMTGSLVKEGKISQQQNSIDVSGLSAGTYILQTTNERGVVKKAKLLKK